MYEYEFWDESKGEYVFLYGYSYDDLKKRYPEEDFSKLRYVQSVYAD